VIENLLVNLESYIEAGSALSLLVVFLGGVLISFTPCVYPILPITIGYIGASSAGSRQKAFSLSVSCVIGMALVYAGLGATAALTGSLFGSFQNSKFIFILVGSICILMGLAMFDLFQIPLPRFLTGHKETKLKGTFGAFLVGMLSGLVVGPCTAPVLAVLLTYVASKQNVVFGSLLMFVFALGMGTLLIIAGTFAGVLTSLPKSGRWMVIIKRIFGLALIAAGVYFVRRLF